MSGYGITIRAFLPCGTDSASHVVAHQIIAGITKSVHGHGFIEVSVTDKYLPNRRAPAEPAVATTLAVGGVGTGYEHVPLDNDMPPIPPELRRA